MKKIFLVFSFLISSNLIFAQCPTPTGLFVTNITHQNALANWTAAQGADHYRIRKRELGTTNWGNLLNIDSTMTSRNLPLLQPLTTYEWKIESYCDSSNQSGSAWSVIDTFTTTAFIPSPFNPQLFFGINTTLCNTHVVFTMRLMQIENEPDISISILTSDGGSFDIASISVGDTVGTAELTTSTDTFYTILQAGLVTGNNYALINSVDSSGIIGFFSIENISGGGVKITSGSPPDGNNYTSGYNSTLVFDNLFVTPISPGVLSFFADIDSKLNDQFYAVDSSTIIFCNTRINENGSSKNLLKIVDFLGRETPSKKKTPLFYIFDDGTVEKKVFID